jgi:hypothetical protein
MARGIFKNVYQMLKNQLIIISTWFARKAWRQQQNNLAGIWLDRNLIWHITWLGIRLGSWAKVFELGQTHSYKKQLLNWIMPFLMLNYICRKNKVPHQTKLRQIKCIYAKWGGVQLVLTFGQYTSYTWILASQLYTLVTNARRAKIPTPTHHWIYLCGNS